MKSLNKIIENILIKLSKDEDWFVRCGVAGNPICPQNILLIPSKDEDSSVRDNVIGNPNCPILP